MQRENRVGQTTLADGDAKASNGEPAEDALHIAQTRTNHAQVVRLPLMPNRSIEGNPGEAKLSAQIGDARRRRAGKPRFFLRHRAQRRRRRNDGERTGGSGGVAACGEQTIFACESLGVDAHRRELCARALHLGRCLCRKKHRSVRANRYGDGRFGRLRRAQAHETCRRGDTEQGISRVGGRRHASHCLSQRANRFEELRHVGHRARLDLLVERLGCGALDGERSGAPAPNELGQWVDMPRVGIAQQVAKIGLSERAVAEERRHLRGDRVSLVAHGALPGGESVC